MGANALGVKHFFLDLVDSEPELAYRSFASVDITSRNTRK